MATSLEVASIAPKRLRAMVLEMPVLDNALVGSAVAFAPLLVAVTIGEPLMRVVSRLTRLIPSSVLPFNIDIVLDTVRQDPGPSGALLQGLFFGRTAPHREERRTFTAPALVIGHQHGDLEPEAGASEISQLLMAVNRGMEVMAKAGLDAAALERVADQAFEGLPLTARARSRQTPQVASDAL